jgi:hypothetical protein
VHGRIQSPLLVWHPAQATDAHAAAERAAKARCRPIVVVSRSDSGWTEGREIQLFTDALEPALLGHRAPSEAKARRLRTEADKLEAFSLVLLQASKAKKHEEFAAVSQAAAKALRAKFGGGSITSASAWLTGRKGQEALQSLLAGEVELSGPLAMRQIVEAVALAQEAESLGQEAQKPDVRR